MGCSGSIQEQRGTSVEFSKRWDLQVSLERLERINHQHRKEEGNSTSSFSNPTCSPNTHYLCGTGNNLEFKNEQDYWYLLHAFYVPRVLRLGPQGAPHLTQEWRPGQSQWWANKGIQGDSRCRVTGAAVSAAGPR